MWLKMRWAVCGRSELYSGTWCALLCLQAHEGLRVPDASDYTHFLVQERGQRFRATQVNPDKDVITAGGDGYVFRLMQSSQFLCYCLYLCGVYFQPYERGGVVADSLRFSNSNHPDDAVL